MMKLSINEISRLRSNDLNQIRENIKDYFLEHSYEFSNYLTRQQFIEKINNGLKHALRYGLNTEYSLTKYLMLVFSFSSQFDEQPEIRRMLAEEEKTANDKIDAVYNKLYDIK
ncbi:MAG: hypothetical protein ACC657_11230 [Thiohalomonadales bacterium]